MADTPPSSDNNPSNNQASQVVEPINDNQGTRMETMKEASPPSVFVNSEPIREDQVQNAVKFLSHPKVRGSPVIHRRSFLERKGLTKEEIDEAFRRVPDQTPAATTTVQSTATNQDGQIRPSSNVQQQPPTQIVQSAPVGSVSKMGTLSRFHWSHALIAIGFLAVSGAGTAVLFKKSIIPKLKSWIRKIVLEDADGEERALVKKDGDKPSIAEEAAAAAKAAAAAAADVARATQEMSMIQSEDKRYIEELVSMLNMQVQEMKSMNIAIQKLGGQTKPARIAADDRDNQMISGFSSRQTYSNGKADADYHSVRSLSPPVESSDPPHPKSYMEIMEMIKRGEKPSNIREINDAPPNPNQPVSNPRLAPKPKPWEVSQNSNYEYTENPVNGDEAAPWWQRRNARITEIEPAEEQKLNPSSSSSSSVISSIERPVQRSWVPPQPPPVAMPEAVAAIRQPKKSVQAEQMNDEQLLSRSADLDELQRITKISESGGAVETNGEEGNHAEMAKEENGSYVEA